VVEDDAMPDDDALPKGNYPPAEGPIGPEFDRPQRPSGRPAWYESWVVECVTDAADVGIRMELRVRPDQNRSQFHMLLIRPGERLVWLDESEAPLPNPGLEVRASGLWMEFNPQVALEHFTADLEAFALALDDPLDAAGDGYGHRVPVACELEWQQRGDPVVVPGGYKVPAFVMGDFQIGHEDLQIDGWGWRSHTWGEDIPIDPFRGREFGSDPQAGDDWDHDASVGLVIGWGLGLDGEHLRLVESNTGIGWRTVAG